MMSELFYRAAFQNRTKLIFLAILLLVCGCEQKAGSIPPESDIEKVSVSLNDPERLSYWDFSGEISKDQFEELRKYFSSKPYSSPLKWQGLAVIEIEKTDGGLFFITVYDTGQVGGGCYSVGGGYSRLNGEAAFYEELRALLEGASK